MDHSRDTTRPTRRSALVLVTIIALLAVLVPDADANVDAEVIEPVPLTIVTPELPPSPTACAEPGTPILPNLDVEVSYIQSGSYRAQYGAENAFDDAQSLWLSAAFESPAWVGADFGNESYFVTKYEVHFANGRLKSRAPRDWTLQGSTDGDNWTVVDTRTDQTGWRGTETRGFEVESPSDFSQYRLNITRDNDARSDIVVASIGELRLFTTCPSPDVRIAHTVAPYSSDCPSDFDAAVNQAALAAPGGATEVLEVSNGAAVRYCVNVKNMGPGVAGTVSFEHPLFASTVFTDLGLAAEGAVEVVRTVRNRNSGLSTVVANATDLLGNDASSEQDSVDLRVTDGFKFTAVAVDDVEPCPAQFLEDPSQPTAAVELELGSTMYLCYAWIALEGTVGAEMLVEHSLLDRPVDSDNVVPGTTYVHRTPRVVTPELAGTSTAILRLINEIGNETIVHEADFVIVVVDP